MSRRFGFCVAFLVSSLLAASQLVAQDAPSDSVRFNQPIPVTIRMANNAVVQTMLVGIDQDGISTITPQGRAVEYAFPKVRTVRSKDGSLFFTPAKDDMPDIITRLGALNPSTPAPTGGIPGGTSFPGGATMPAMPAMRPQPGLGHAPAMPTQMGLNSGPSAPSMMAHSQPSSPSSYSPPSMQPQFSNPPPHPTGMPNMPMGGHSQMPSPNMSMPGMNGNNPMHSNMGAPNMGQQMVMQYECTKCHYKFTSPTEIKAGHRCTNCGVVWGEIKDENGRTLSSSPAARIGGGVGILVFVISVIVAIVRKVQS